MYCLTIYLSDGKRKALFYYSEDAALKYLVRYLVEWFTNYYDVHYDFEDYPFPVEFWNNTLSMTKCVDNMLTHIDDEVKEPSLVYPVKYDLEEFKFVD